MQAANNKGAAPLIFAYGINRFSHDMAYLILKLLF